VIDEESYLKVMNVFNIS